MNRFNFIILLIFFISLVSQPMISAQENDTTTSEVILKKMRLPFPISKDKKSKYYSLDDEIATALAEAVREMGFNDIVVGIYIDSTLEIEDNAFADFVILNFDETDRYKEAIVVIQTEIFQQGVPPDEDDAFFLIGNRNLRKNTSDYSRNTQTQLLVYALFVNIETGESLGSLELEIFHTGGSPKKSQAKAMELLRKKAIYELKKIYWFSSEMILTQVGMFGIPYGTKSRAKKGLTFELIEPDRIWESDCEEFIVSGGSAGIATVKDTAAESSGLNILRQWRDVYPGCWAVEHPDPILALAIDFIPPATESYTNLSVQLHARPIRSFDFGFGMQFVRVTDSYEEDDYGFGFGGFGIWRFLNTSKIDLGGKLGVDLDIPFKKDDNGQSVHAVLFSTYIGIISEFLISRNFDFIISAGYRLGAKNNQWEYSEDEETFTAYWEEDAPEVNNSGLMLSVGFKYLLF